MSRKVARKNRMRKSIKLYGGAARGQGEGKDPVSEIKRRLPNDVAVKILTAISNKNNDTNALIKMIPDEHVPEDEDDFTNLVLNINRAIQLYK